jgi:hypothetical protein
MRIELNKTPEQAELLRALGSKDPKVSSEAASALAGYIGPIIQEVIQQASTTGLIYRDLNFNEDDNPSLPLDLYYDKDVGYIQTWSQQIAGGLPTSEVQGGKEMKISTFKINSAVSFLKKYARRARFDVLNSALGRMSQDVLIKQEINGWSVVLKALAEAATKGQDHIISSTTAGRFQIDDLNRLMTLVKRINQSFADGTAVNVGARRLTDIVVSPEVIQDIRAFAYNPLNTTATPDTAESTALGLPDSIRTQIYNSAGITSIYNVNVIELSEFGVGQKFNTLFDGFYNGSSPTFNGSTQEIIVGLDMSRDSFVRAIATQEGNATFVVQPDDQFVAREDKTGFYGEQEVGYVCIDARAIFGIVK